MDVTFGLVNALQWSFIGGLLVANTSGMYQPNLKKDIEIYTNVRLPFTYIMFFRETGPFIMNYLCDDCLTNRSKILTNEKIIPFITVYT